MIRVIYHIFTKEIITILFASDGFTAFDQQTQGMIQGDRELVVSQASLLNLNMAPIIEFLDANGIGDPLIARRLKVERDMAFGRKLKIMFLSEQKEMDLTLAEDAVIYQQFNPMLQWLDIGAINRVQEMWAAVPVDGVIITAERKAMYTNLLSEYLGN